jgi:hypothetical protein
MEVWVSEFLHRNERFKLDYEALPSPWTEKGRRAWDRFFACYGIHSVRFDPRSNRPEVTIPPVHSLRLVGSADSHRDKVVQLQVFGGDSPGSEPGFRDWLLVEPDTTPARIFRGLMGEVRAKELSKASNLLLLSIDLSRPRKDINTHIKELLKVQKPTDKARARADVWRPGLMVFDLRHSNDPGKRPSFGEVALAMTHADQRLKKDDSLGYRGARALYYISKNMIEGGYKKFL